MGIHVERTFFVLKGKFSNNPFSLIKLRNEWSFFTITQMAVFFNSLI